MSELEDILNYLETTSLEPHDDYVSEFSYKDQKTLWKYIKELQQENQELKKQLQELEEQSVNAINKQVTKGIDLINREAEFMKWLKDSLDALEMCDREFILTNHKKEIKVYEDILGKYKEIIGKDINVSTK